MRDKNAVNNLQLKMGCFFSFYQLIVPQNGLDKKDCNKSKIDLVNFYFMHNTFFTLSKIISCAMQISALCKDQFLYHFLVSKLLPKYAIECCFDGKNLKNCGREKCK